MVPPLSGGLACKHTAPLSTYARSRGATLKSTKKTSVREVAPGVYRVTGVGARNAMTGRYVRAVTAARSASSGRFVTAATSRRNPGGTVTETTSGKGGSGSTSRSASTGRYVTPATAQPSSGGTATESGR